MPCTPISLERFFHLVELERLDDRLDLFQGDLSYELLWTASYFLPVSPRKLIEKSRK